ncbi:hypothetical protein MJO28_009319 [Puccinia striiformis f. sp. tritici]|uniref:Uncharacterized protein n=1 Tax=Puccinia striiformis f. sp. tritici TaxID=168172 RepID=A0ACC0E8Z4_9BASI|nr:hypothetical protein Pst134EA_017747 [Puccinia striiformis f. sp. tritici]KAH9461440.1 hypothetical protein Pst134EA_017747 [Puccinia striiformis f. sp. tritici]KAI7947411.1 hypothetical protein MJO28_009319 [Puccinia striiformis f. sp. tritici]
MVFIIKKLVDLTSITIGMARILKTALRIQTIPESNNPFRSPSRPNLASSPSSSGETKSSQLTGVNHVQKGSSQQPRRSFSTFAAAKNIHNRKNLDARPSSSSSTIEEPVGQSNSDPAVEDRPSPLRASRVPSSRLGRLFHYGGLAAGIGWGTASEAFRRTASGQHNNSHPLTLSEANVRRLVDKLTKMRGAALKLGQFLAIQGCHSISDLFLTTPVHPPKVPQLRFAHQLIYGFASLKYTDAKILPPQIEEVFVKVQCTADYMPFDQAEAVLKEALGKDWSKKFINFTQVPVAAASIGQVHVAQITDGEKGPIKAAVKVQFPGVYESIQSDLSYLGVLASTSSILPKGLFLSKSIEVLGQELKDECDYTREARYGTRMAEYLKDDPRFIVPKVFDHLSAKMVLTTEFMSGCSLRQAAKWSQALRNKIGHDVLELCFREILHFRLMQTDPNWSNFLWNESTQQIELIDFGATREYSEKFIDGYLKLLKAGIEGSRADCIEASIELGYLTGDECETMLDSQYKTVKALGEPFRRTSQQPYDFSQQTVTDRVRSEIPTIVRLRLTPPPIETYSLNRKLSGMFLLCNRLGSKIDCHTILDNLMSQKTAGSWGRHPPDSAVAS